MLYLDEKKLMYKNEKAAEVFTIFNNIDEIGWDYDLSTKENLKELYENDILKIDIDPWQMLDYSDIRSYNGFKTYFQNIQFKILINDVLVETFESVEELAHTTEKVDIDELYEDYCYNYDCTNHFSEYFDF